MATITSPGIGSGLDVNSIVSQLIAADSAPLTKMKSAASTIQTQISAYGQIHSLVSTLRDAAAALAGPSLWQQTTGSSANSAAVAATTSSGAPVGSLNVQVDQLARAQTLASASMASATTVVGAGRLTIDLGSWATGNTSFTANSGSTALQLDFTDPNTTLSDVRDRINAAGAGVSAVIVTDATGSRLSLSSKSTGTTNALRVVATDSNGAPLSGGLSALAYDPPNGSSGLTEVQSAADAKASINGLAIVSASNHLTTVVNGVTLDLKQVTSSPVAVTVDNDQAGMRDAIKKFVDAYNAMNTFLVAQTKYDPATKTAATLQGDSAAVGLRDQMRSMLTQASTASGTFTRLSDVGLALQQDGSIVIDSKKLDAGFANLPEMTKLFSQPLGAAAGSDGIAVRMRQLADAVNGSTGVLTSRTDGLQARLKRNQDDQSRLQDRLDARQTALLKQYQSLDVSLGQLNGLSSYVTQQMKALSASSSSN